MGGAAENHHRTRPRLKWAVPAGGLCLGGACASAGKILVMAIHIGDRGGAFSLFGRRSSFMLRSGCLMVKAETAAATAKR